MFWFKILNSFFFFGGGGGSEKVSILLGIEMFLDISLGHY